jgi:pyruvate formate lyase activating enzyme
LVANLQRFSLHDGPGIRTTVFLKGCPLACLWCHNPENRSHTPEIITVQGRCIRCGECVEVCPEHLSGPEIAAAQAADVCRRCGACVENCPTGARQKIGRRMSVAAVLDEVGKDTVFYDESHGGVTFSGGEPLAQPEFLRALLAACAARGIHTAVDTCGFTAREELLSVAAATGLFLYDLKVMDDAKHRRFTGVSNALILDNLRCLGTVHDNIWLRVPIIPGLNDADEDIDAMTQFAASLAGVRQVNLLPYHKTAVHKFQQMSRPYGLADTPPPSPQYMDKVLERFRQRGLNAKVGG